MGISIFEHSASSGASATGKPEKRKGKAKLALRPLWRSPQFRKIFILRNYVYPYYTSCPRRLSRRFEKSALFFYPAKGPACKAASFFPGNSCPKEALSHNFEPMLKYLPYPPPSAARPTLFPNRFELKKGGISNFFPASAAEGLCLPKCPAARGFPPPLSPFLKPFLFSCTFPERAFPRRPKKTTEREGLCLICCSCDCRYQIDGVCTLAGGAAVTNSAASGCAFYEKK